MPRHVRLGFLIPSCPQGLLSKVDLYHCMQGTVAMLIPKANSLLFCSSYIVRHTPLNPLKLPLTSEEVRDLNLQANTFSRMLTWDHKLCGIIWTALGVGAGCRLLPQRLP